MPPPIARLPCLLRLLWIAAAPAIVGAIAGTARAQSIGDWNGTYRTQPAAAASSTPPRIEPSPTVTPTPKARRHQPPHPMKKPAGRAPSTAPAAPPKPAATPSPPPAPKPVASPAAPPIPKPHPIAHPVAAAKPAPAPDLPQWPLGVAALLGGAAGWALWRRKSPGVIPVDEPAPPPVVAAPPPPPPAPPEPEPELILSLVPTRFATTLTEAILRYDLTLTNRTGQPLGPVVITGAIAPTGSGAPDAAPPSQPRPPAFRPAPGFSPHPHFMPAPLLAPAPPEAPAPRRAPPPGPLPELHRMMLLHMGESLRLQGQLRLPLAEITPIRLGGAALFIPLVRVQVEATGARDDAIFETALCMVVGEAAQTGAGSALGPFRLDDGPTVARHLAIRDIPLDAVG